MFLAIVSDIEAQDDREFMISLYDNYYGLVYKKISFSLPKCFMDVADDLVQEIFIKLIHNVKKLRALNSNELTAYIVYTSKSVMIDFLRKHARSQEQCQFDYEIAEMFPAADCDQPEIRLCEKDGLSALGQSLSSLSENDRIFLYFHFVAGYSYKEMGSLFEMKENTIRQRVFQAKQRAYKLLNSQGEENNQ